MTHFDVLPDERTIATTAAALDANGFGVDVVDDLTAARKAMLARIPPGARVWKNTSITVDEAGISAEVDAADGPYESVRLQKVVPDLETARRRVREHSLPLENLRAHEAYGQNSRLNKTLEIYGEVPGRIHLVLIRQAIGY